MNPKQLEFALQSALVHHQAGRIAQAEQMYRQILSTDTNQPDALHLLGLIAHQAKQYSQAIELISRAIGFKPNWPEAIYNLSTALNESGRRDEAIAGYRRALAMKPNFAVAWNSLAGALAGNGNLAEAIAAYRSALTADANYPDAHNNLGNALRNSGDLPGAIAAYQRAIALRPDYPQAYSNLGVALQESGQLPDAMAAYMRALQLKPDYPSARANFAIAMDKLAQQQAAENNLDEASENLKNAIALNPSVAAYHNNLGIVLFDAGRIEEARQAFERATEMEPDNASFASAWLSTLHYAAGSDARAIAQKHFEWGRRFSNFGSIRRDTGLWPVLLDFENQHLSTSDATVMGRRRRRPMSPRSDPVDSTGGPSQESLQRSGLRRVRIGYVSADFRWHPVGRFLLPLLAHHNRDAFEVFCYSNVKVADATTVNFRQLSDHWRDISCLGDDATVEQIRRDGIDILIDLSGHTSGNRLPVFARRPGRVQISYLGYAGTTGVAEMDYRLTDAHADPLGMTEHLHTEKLIRLPINWCFAEPMGSPPVVIREPGPIRFGSFNHLCKVTDAMLHAWGRILQAVPGSELILKAGSLASVKTRLLLRDRMMVAGIPLDRISLREPTAGFTEHLRAFQSIDIALDTFPYHGTTTTCEALWMGVPVITLEGDSHVSRVGVSLLHSVGLEELIAKTPEDYVALAVALANDPDRLGEWRRSLREWIMGSPLMGAPRFTRDFESALLAMMV